MDLRSFDFFRGVAKGASAFRAKSEGAPCRDHSGLASKPQSNAASLNL
jgi:hypothetical protein